MEQEHDIVIDMRNLPVTVGPQKTVAHVFTEPPKETLDDYRIQYISPQDLPSVWQWVRKGLIAVKKATGHRTRWTPMHVRAKISQNQVALFFCFRNDTPVGFYVSFMETDQNLGAPLTLIIWIAYNEDEGGGAVTAAIEHFTKMGYQIGAEEIAWISPRKGWLRRAAQLGFEVGEVVYFKSLYDDVQY